MTDLDAARDARPVGAEALEFRRPIRGDGFEWSAAPPGPAAPWSLVAEVVFRTPGLRVAAVDAIGATYDLKHVPLDSLGGRSAAARVVRRSDPASPGPESPLAALRALLAVSAGRDARWRLRADEAPTLWPCLAGAGPVREWIAASDAPTPTLLLLDPPAPLREAVQRADRRYDVAWTTERPGAWDVEARVLLDWVHSCDERWPMIRARFPVDFTAALRAWFDPRNVEARACLRTLCALADERIEGWRPVELAAPRLRECARIFGSAAPDFVIEFDDGGAVAPVIDADTRSITVPAPALRGADRRAALALIEALGDEAARRRAHEPPPAPPRPVREDPVVAPPSEDPVWQQPPLTPGAGGRRVPAYWLAIVGGVCLVCGALLGRCTAPDPPGFAPDARRVEDPAPPTRAFDPVSMALPHDAGPAVDPPAPSRAAAPDVPDDRPRTRRRRAGDTGASTAPPAPPRPSSSRPPSDAVRPARGQAPPQHAGRRRVPADGS